MNYKQFLNKKIINKNNEQGIITFFDDEHIKVKYLEKETTYSSEISFKNKYLTFIDTKLQSLIEEDLLKKENKRLQKEKAFEENNKIVIKRNKTILEQYRKLYQKNRILHCLFGRDFDYPPYKDFKKKYKYLIREPHAEGIIAQTYGKWLHSFPYKTAGTII